MHLGAELERGAPTSHDGEDSIISSRRRTEFAKSYYAAATEQESGKFMAGLQYPYSGVSLGRQAEHLGSMAMRRPKIRTASPSLCLMYMEKM